MPKYLRATLAFLCLLAGSVFATNSLSIRKDHTHGSYPAYIDDATLVVEPMVGFASVSLILSYADHGQFPGNDVEVVQSFELPKDARVNDLWLWIGDSIMQARVYELPKAQHIYDSITSFKRDPAFLSLSHGQYELHVYPLASGKFRKVKLTMQVPMTWVGAQPRVALPLALLKSNNLARKPLRFLLRSGNMPCRNPDLLGVAGFRLPDQVDTLGYTYQATTLPDIGSLDRLDLTFEAGFSDGSLYQTDKKLSGNRFAFGFYPGDFFPLSANVKGKGKVLVGLDLSGDYEPEMETFSTRMQDLVGGMLAAGDSLKLMVSGASRLETYPATGWSIGGIAGINALLEQFRNGNLFAAKKERQPPRLLLTDKEATNCWGFNGLEQVSRLTTTTTGIMNALDKFRDADVVASYGQGYEEHLTSDNADAVQAALMPFFERGGWFLTYIDFNRKQEMLATRLIKGLKIPDRFQATTLSGIPTAGIGKGLPSSMYHHSNNPLISNDPEVRVEMVDEWNRPVIISKAFGKGRLVVSGVWSNNDPDGVKKAMSMALLGLQEFSAHSDLDKLLAGAAAERNGADRFVFLSNSDSAIDAAGADAGAKAFLAKAGGPAPRVDAVNLLSGQAYIPSHVAYQGQDYLGSGLLLKFLSDLGGGTYESAAAKTWPQIVEAFHPHVLPEPLSLSVSVEPAASQEEVPLELGQVLADPDKPRFFVGAAAPGDSIRLSLEARFRGIDSVFRRAVKFPAAKDAAYFASPLGALLASEKIAFLLKQPKLDTAAIVTLALQSGLVTDFTALLALEPDATHGFLKDPNDESIISVATKAMAAAGQDSLGITAAFSPSENRWHFTVSVPAGGRLELAVYDLAGRRIFQLSQAMGTKGAHMFAGNPLGAASAQNRFCIAFVKFVPESPLNGKRELVKIARLAR